jgi:hypothetical protein
MTYADYAYYAGIYVGSVSEEDFSRLAVRASSFLDYYTQNRAKDNAELDAVKMCCCALIDQYALLDAAQKAATKSLANAGDPETKSESVGSYSRTLTTGGEAAKSVLDAVSTSKQMLANLCNEYLAHTGLLYRGGGCKCTLPTL